MRKLLLSLNHFLRVNNFIFEFTELGQGEICYKNNPHQHIAVIRNKEIALETPDDRAAFAE